MGQQKRPGSWIQAAWLQSLLSWWLQTVPRGSTAQTHLWSNLTWKEGTASAQRAHQELTRSRCFSAHHCALRAKVPSFQVSCFTFHLYLLGVYIFWVMHRGGDLGPISWWPWPWSGRSLALRVVPRGCSYSSPSPQLPTLTRLPCRFRGLLCSLQPLSCAVGPPEVSGFLSVLFSGRKAWFPDKVTWSFRRQVRELCG